ncbi:unnamed protein product [Rotaria sp. Silwood1]|nr:unnamed protein product [Rotaria sp. Silwood1]
MEQNRGAFLGSDSSRTLLLMDATGSMSGLLSAAKDTVCTMFERALIVLKEKGLSQDSFIMQFAMYRNYNSRENKILEVSSWETKASNLRTFMNTIRPEGGWGDEAVEIGLWHAVQESQTQESIAQVIIIADAPANTEENVKPRLMGFLNEKCKDDLTNFEESIKILLSTMLLKELTSIEDFMNSDNALEAERSIENFNCIERELTNHFTMENVTQKAKEVKKKIDTLASDILERNDFKDIEKYPKKSPRDLLAKLERAANYRSEKYTPVYTFILGEIQHNFDTAISNACDAPIEKRSAQMRPLNYALRFLSEDLQQSFRPLMNELTKKFEDEERAYKRDLKGFLENDNVDDSTIKRLNDLALQYKQEKRHEPLEILRVGVIKKLDNHWENVQNGVDKDDIQLAINNMKQIIKYQENVKHISEVEGFYQKVCTLIKSFLNNMKNIIFYSDMISELTNKIIDLTKNFDVELTSDETTRFEVIRDQYFNNLAVSLKALKSINSEFKNRFSSIVNIEKLEKELKEKVEELKRKLLVYASQDEFSLSDSDYFRMCYNHLISFDKYVRLSEVKIRDSLELAETQIIDKVTLLSKDIANSDADIMKVAKLLVKIKFFAENFSMFDTKINGMIDDVLKSYKTQQSSLILSQLTMALEKTDVGSRLIAEHSSLSAEDWRKRREKMQKQDDLDYVIGELEGDDVSKDVLRSRYKTFRQMYDELISTILASFNPKTEKEPNIEVLITQTKVLLGTVAQKVNDITWDYSFRDKIPELLADIFAVWTLKNTQHYNAMRGTNASQAYLLMPHVAQVIAIFRILGLGYEKIQIGTGEGKSVVMAITACVFALVGLDVNCSCYSEYLKLSSIKQDVQTITEKVSSKERELCIKRAASEGKVTLLTRTFGRGTDFICRNPRVLANGGIHVLQTFFSEELSEEYQIMGRGARQGDRGSYRMVLLDRDLEWVLGAAWEEEIPKISGSPLYAALNKARNALYESKCAAKEVGIEQCRHEHESSKSFMNALSEGKLDIVKKFLTDQNREANIVSGTSRTLLLMDATGSMSSLLSAAKDTVCTMFERASVVLGEKGLSKDAFSMQFAVYRNYSSRDNKILEVSSWETKASHLRAFMNTIGPEGGMGEEAIEIGFWHAAKESETQDGISQVILIGDAPANTKSDVTSKRARLGEAYWKQTRFATPTYYEDELQKLKNKNIPVHAFYLTDWAKDNFQRISEEAKGRCESLNIYSTAGAESLTNFVTEEVLRKTAGDQGDAVVELYRKKYSKTTFTS